RARRSAISLPDALPISVVVKRAMIEWLGPVVAEYYGGTETGPVTFCTSEQWLAHPGTVGRPLEGATVAILDADGRRLPAGQSGEDRKSTRLNSSHLVTS